MQGKAEEEKKLEGLNDVDGTPSEFNYDITSALARERGRKSVTRGGM